MSEEIDLETLDISLNDVLDSEWPREKAIAWSRAANAPFAKDLWDTVAGLGWTALTVAERHGGLGLGKQAAMRLHMALGAAAAPAPIQGTTLAAHLLNRAGSEAQRERLLPGIADGSIRIAFGAHGSAALDADGPTVSGTARDLLDLASATHAFLVATRAGARGWLVVPIEAAEVQAEAIALVDRTRTFGNLALNALPIDEHAFIAASDADHDSVLGAAMLAIAGDAQGGGEAVLKATVAYMQGREQFGVPIASFQALKHRVADHHTALVASRHLLEHAASLRDDDPSALLHAAAAKQHATRVAAEVARDCIQLHGGVGFTAEYVPHVYLKRAKINECLWGTRAQTLDYIASLLEAA